MSSPDYQKQRSFSDKFIPSIKNIVGPHLLRISTIDEDTKQASDLVVLSAVNKNNRPLTIACRVRSCEKKNYYLIYKDQFTFRYRSQWNGKTEFEKIKEGWGDWFFYGHQEKPGSYRIHPWWIIDLDVFRYYIQNPVHKKMIWYEVKDNIGEDDNTALISFKISKFPILDGKELVLHKTWIFEDMENIELLPGFKV